MWYSISDRTQAVTQDGVLHSREERSSDIIMSRVQYEGSR